MLIFVNRSLSLLVYLAYITAGFNHGGGAVALKLAIGLLLPVACIWFPEPLGDYTGIIRGQLMTASTPGTFSLCRRLASLGRRASHCLRYFSWHVNRSNQSLQLTAGWRDDQLGL